MVMKKRNLSGVFVFIALFTLSAVCSTLSGHSPAVTETNQKVNGVDIVLKGEIGETPIGGPRREVNSSITATIINNQTAIQSIFNSDIGIITVVITDKLGNELYKKVVNTTIQISLSTNISFLPAGTYTLYYKSALGGELHSDFIIS